MCEMCARSTVGESRCQAQSEYVDDDTLFTRARCIINNSFILHSGRMLGGFGKREEKERMFCVKLCAQVHIVSCVRVV